MAQLGRLATALLALVVALPLLAAAAVWLALEAAPLVPPPAEVSVDDIARANALLRRHDPRLVGAAGLRTVDLTQRDAELLFAQLTRRYGQPAARVQLQSGTARVQASLRLPQWLGAPWLNIDAVLLESDTLPVVTSLKIGRLPLPGWLAAWLIEAASARLAGTAEGQLAGRMFRHIAFQPNQFQLVYEWHADAPQQLMATLLPPADQARLRAYVELLARITPAMRAQRMVPMARLLVPLFALAAERSAAPGGDAERENRAALIALSFYANHRSLRPVVPASWQWPQPVPLHLTLHGRVDWPLHYLVSAMLAAEAGSPLAHAVGLFKELADSRGGSGFSFGDLAADRAGTRFGTLAVREPARLQGLLALRASQARGVDDADLMPAAADLPEYMAEAEFKRRFGGVGAPAYLSMLAAIDARLEATPLLAR